MKLSSAAYYALKAAAYLAGQENGRLVPSREIAEAEGFPMRFLVRALCPLVKAGVLAAVPSSTGGYRLARRAGKITVLEVVEAAQGPVRGEVPAVGAGPLPRLESLCKEVAEAARAALGRVTVADLAGGKQRKGK